MRSKTGERTFTEQARQGQIVQCAIEVIAEQGFSQASIARIAQRAGVAKSVVLYHFASKDDLVAAIVAQVMAEGAQAITPAVRAEAAAAGKLVAYIRANCAYLDAHRTASVAMFEIMTGFRTADGLRLDQAAARSAGTQPPSGDMASLDPVHIFELGVDRGEFGEMSPRHMKNALRGALDGAVAEIARDESYDVIGYGEVLVAVFERATRRTP